jgi:hypothetical protein
VRSLLVVGVVALLACSSNPKPESASPAAGPAAVAAAFMQAVADSDLTQMGSLWGTDQGPAATTNTPSNWAQRIAVIHAYLHGGTSRVLGEGDPALSKAGHRQVLVELNRSGCTKTVPFTMVRTKAGAWLVNVIDLNAAGVPGRPCGSTSQPPGT